MTGKCYLWTAPEFACDDARQIGEVCPDRPGMLSDRADAGPLPTNTPTSGSIESRKLEQFSRGWGGRAIDFPARHLTIPITNAAGAV